MTILPIWRPGHYHLEMFLPKWHSKKFVNESKYCRKMKWYKHGLSKKPLKIPMGLAKSKIHFWKQSLKMEMDSKLLPFSICSTVKDQLQLSSWYLRVFFFLRGFTGWLLLYDLMLRNKAVACTCQLHAFAYTRNAHCKTCFWRPANTGVKQTYSITNN